LLKTKELNRKITENHEDLASWYELIELQDLIKSTGMVTNHNMITEKKISILERVLEKPKMRTDLCLNLMLIQAKKTVKATGDFYSSISKLYKQL
jgi:NRDE-2, necessary for RNA interference